jgi:hypothetical protein
MDYQKGKRNAVLFLSSPSTHNKSNQTKIRIQEEPAQHQFQQGKTSQLVVNVIPPVLHHHHALQQSAKQIEYPTSHSPLPSKFQ